MHVHIGYGDSATGCLKEAMDNHGLPGDAAIPSRDDFTQGPISDCFTKEGLEQRIEYWVSINTVLGFKDDIASFYHQSLDILIKLEADEVTLWVGDSSHDVLATGWLLAYLVDKDLTWYIIDLAIVAQDDLPNDLPPVNLAMYTPEKVVYLYKYRRLLDDEMKNQYLSIWQKAALENSQFRIQQDGDIVSVEEDYFDDYILSYLSNDFEPSSTLIGKILHDGSHRISDTTIEWRIRKLIDQKKIAYQGDLSSMKTYSIRQINS